MDEPIKEVRMWRCANKDTRIRVKNITSGESIIFYAMVNVGRFVGASGSCVRYGMGDSRARVFCIDGNEYVFVYDDVERPIMQEYKRSPPLTQGLIEAVSMDGERTPLYSYLSAAKFLGLLIGHVLDEEEREEKGELARVFRVGGKRYTMEFGERKRQQSCGRNIHCHWKGIYDRFNINTNSLSSTCKF